MLVRLVLVGWSAAKHLDPRDRKVLSDRLLSERTGSAAAQDRGRRVRVCLRKPDRRRAETGLLRQQRPLLGGDDCKRAAALSFIQGFETLATHTLCRQSRQRSGPAHFVEMQESG